MVMKVGKGMKIKVIVIDDDHLVALSLKTILEASGNIDIAATGKDGSEALELYRAYRPDVLVMDIRMKNVTGLEAAGEVLDEFADAKILLLTTFNDDEYIVKALKLGAKGYILKQDFEGIEPAIMAVAGGQTVFGGEVIGKLPSLINMSAGMTASSAGMTASGDDVKKAIDRELSEKNISEKEIAIIELVAEGYNNKEIAEQLYLSEGTVRNYLSGILEKLELRDRTQLAVYYLGVRYRQDTGLLRPQALAHQGVPEHR